MKNRDDDNVPNDGVVLQRNTGKAKVTGNSGDVASSSQSFPTPTMVTKEDFVRVMRDTECCWVYARFAEERGSVPQRLYALDIKGNGYVLLPDPPMNLCSDNASSVLDSNLYLIGGKRGTILSFFVHFFNPVLYSWHDATFSDVERSTGCTAASVDGRIYVFGGCPIRYRHWCEMYDPSTQEWTALRRSLLLANVHMRGLTPLRASAVLGNKIILRGAETGIAFDVMLNSWTSISDNLINGWWECIRAAVVGNMLITCHGEMDEFQKSHTSIGAYDPGEDIWLPIEGIDNSFHENAHRSEFMSVNGNLVIYHMWEQDDLRYSVIQISKRLRTTVKATLLCQSRFPIATIINEGLDVRRDRIRRCVYKPILMEAFRANM